jgi:hypothetical protein
LIWIKKGCGTSAPSRHFKSSAKGSGSLGIFAAIRRASSLVRNFAAEIDLAVVSSNPNAGPKAKENGRPERERDHNCVPQRHGATD